MESKRQWMATNRPKTLTVFRSLFPGNNELAETIGNHMREHGYDESQPIILWDRSEGEGRNALYVVDGHTRLVAAKQVGLSPVYVARVKFPDEKAALEYAIHNQRDRRNLIDADLFRCIEAVDRQKSRGGDRKSEKSKASSEAIDSGKSAAQTAKMVGTSKTKVEKARSVIKHAAGKIKEEVLSGKKSIHKAYKETQQKRKPKPKREGAGRPAKYTAPRDMVILNDFFDAIDNLKEKISDTHDRCTNAEWKKIKALIVNSVKEVTYYPNEDERRMSPPEHGADISPMRH